MEFVPLFFVLLFCVCHVVLSCAQWLLHRSVERESALVQVDLDKRIEEVRVRMDCIKRRRDDVGGGE